MNLSISLISNYKVIIRFTIRNSRTNKRRLGILVFLPSVVPVPNVAVGFISPAARAASNFDINIGNLEEYVINTESVLLLAHSIPIENSLTAIKSKMHI